MAPKRKAAPTAKSRGSAIAAGAQLSLRATAQMPAAPQKKESKDAAPDPAAAELQKVCEQIFALYDSSKSGRLDWRDFLGVEEDRLGNDFVAKARREALAWFKEAGAEGNPKDGLYLSSEAWCVAFTNRQSEVAGIPSSDVGALAAWLNEHYLKTLLQQMSPCAGAVSSGAAGSQAAAVPAVPAVPPEYPLTIKFQDLAKHIAEARLFGRRVLVLSSGLQQLETFMQYADDMYTPLDAKQIINEVFVKKSVTREKQMEQLRDILKGCLNVTGGNVRSLWIRLANSAFDLSSFCGDQSMPSEVFSESLWTPELALKKEFIDQSQKMNLELGEMKKWKEFGIVITSTFDLESGNEFLANKIPHFDELAILVVDPKSVN